MVEERYIVIFASSASPSVCVCISVLRIFFLKSSFLFRKSLVPEKIQIKREVILVILKLTIVSFEDLCCIFLVGTWLIFP